MRQDIWVKGRKLTKEEKLEKQKWKREFNVHISFQSKNMVKKTYYEISEVDKKACSAKK